MHGAMIKIPKHVLFLTFFHAFGNALEHLQWEFPEKEIF